MEFDATRVASGSQNMSENVHEKTRIPTKFDAAIRALFPSGRRQEIIDALDNRATWSAICHWRKGRRGPPQWVIDRLRKRVAVLDELTPGPGLVAGKYNLPTIRDRAITYRQIDLSSRKKLRADRTAPPPK